MVSRRGGSLVVVLRRSRRCRACRAMRRQRCSARGASRTLLLWRSPCACSPSGVSWRRRVPRRRRRLFPCPEQYLLRFFLLRLLCLSYLFPPANLIAFDFRLDRRHYRFRAYQRQDFCVGLRIQCTPLWFAGATDGLTIFVVSGVYV